MRVKSDSVLEAEKLIKNKWTGWGLGTDQVISYLFGSFFMTVLPYDVIFFPLKIKACVSHVYGVSQ